MWSCEGWQVDVAATVLVVEGTLDVVVGVVGGAELVEVEDDVVDDGLWVQAASRTPAESAARTQIFVRAEPVTVHPPVAGLSTVWCVTAPAYRVEGPRVQAPDSAIATSGGPSDGVPPPPE